MAIPGIAEQEAANKRALIQSIQAQQIQQVTPFGQVRFEGAPLTPERKAITELSAAGQQQLAQREQIAGLLGQAGLGAAQGLGTIASNSVPANGRYGKDAYQFDRVHVAV